MVGNFEVKEFEDSPREEAFPVADAVTTFSPESNIAIVTGHPDDSMLFAVFPDNENGVSKSYECFLGLPVEGGELTAGRQKMIESFPYKNFEFLGITEPVSFDGIDFQNFKFQNGEVHIEEDALRERYLQCREEIKVKLHTKLKDVTDVLTHNPWGEYGHPDHINVYWAMRELQQEMKFKVWVNTFGAERSLKLANHHKLKENAEFKFVQNDPDKCNALEQHYKDTGAWTWVNNKHPYAHGNIFVNADDIEFTEDAPTTHALHEHPLIQQGLPSPFWGGKTPDGEDGDKIFNGAFQSFHPMIQYNLEPGK